ncbi:hypothetical protein PanWU01x14_355290 [Parasponia andersonii]|uniref:Uncharacterized protein n=1 Tax=Parasponia andersonii TaxID=3476 RepID=A0A2P5A9D5_PARAD|nr:hypothetical protein PanWU01x14_355290 [Parasponia andersonii]
MQKGKIIPIVEEFFEYKDLDEDNDDLANRNPTTSELQPVAERFRDCYFNERTGWPTAQFEANYNKMLEIHNTQFQASSQSGSSSSASVTDAHIADEVLVHVTDLGERLLLSLVPDVNMSTPAPIYLGSTSTSFGMMPLPPPLPSYFAHPLPICQEDDNEETKDEDLGL